MRKIKLIIVFVLTLILSFTLIGCKEKELSFKSFSGSLESFEDVSGYDQTLRIKRENTVVYEESRILSSNNDEYILRTQVIKRLNDLDSESQYSENEEPEETIVSEVDNDLKIVFKEEYFQNDFEINQEEFTFTGKIKTEFIKEFMKDDNFSGQDLRVRLVLNQNRKLKTIEILYLSENNNEVMILTDLNY